MKGDSTPRAGRILRRLATKCHDGKSMAIVTVGIDLAKNVFAVHGLNTSN